MRSTSIPLVFAALLCAAPAAGQQARPERPNRAIFGGGIGETEQLLTVKFGVNGGYDDNVLASGSPETGTAGDPRAAKSGGYGQASADISYSLDRSRVGFSTWANTRQRQYSSSIGDFLGTYAGGASGWFQLAKRTRLTVSESSSLQPFLSYAFFPVPGIEPVSLSEDVQLPEPVEPDFDLSILTENQWQHMASLGLSQGLTSRMSVSLGAGYNVTRTSDQSRNITSYSGDGRLSVTLTRGVAFHAGYGHQEARYQEVTEAPAPVIHNIDVGFDVNRALSFSRRTHLSFSSGSTAVQTDGRTVYRVTGNARLSREFGRTWNGSLVYTRDAQFMQNLREPIFADVVSLQVRGLVTRRLRLNTRLGASLGTVGLTESNNYDSYFGSADINFALSRNVALTVDYTYYRYSFDQTGDIPRLSQREMNRQSVQAGVSVWLPVMHRSRRPDAAR